MSTTPVADYALLSDCHSAALVSAAGSVDWLCWPRFDSPSVFGRLLDDAAGHWSVRPVGPCESTRRYVSRTLVVETTFRTPTGSVTVTDALATGAGNRGHALGTGAPHLLIRSLVATDGGVDVEIDYRPRPEYGLLCPLLSPVPGGVLARGGAERLALSCPADLVVEGSTARGRLALRPGDRVLLALHRSTLEEPPARTWTQAELAERLDDTVAAWQSWSDLHEGYDGPWRDAVRHSGRVLQGLTFRPSGAVVAAATTSLPEEEGGVRNWDYRYSWVRDASLTMEALWVAACPDEASSFFTFMTTAAAASVGPTTPLQIMFGVGGEHDLSERTLPHLAGWRGSRPVRVGNAAWTQQQIDVYGELLSAAHRLEGRMEDVDDDVRDFLVALADSAEHRWQEPDQGIWEVRGRPRHFLFSKVMCWVALDRAVRLAHRLDAADRVAGWTATGDRIRRAVLRDGWDESAGAFTQSIGSTALDASALMMPIVGFLPADDPRMLATIEAIASRLVDDRGLVRRYSTPDGLEGGEGAFLLCTFWLAHALALAGQVDRARAVFTCAAGHANDVGLLAEEVDPASGELLGNFPQAFSHIGLINAAWAIQQAERRVDAP